MQVLGDVRLVQFFKDKNMDRIFQHQMRLMTLVGGSFLRTLCLSVGGQAYYCSH